MEAITERVVPVTDRLGKAISSSDAAASAGHAREGVQGSGQEGQRVPAPAPDVVEAQPQPRKVLIVEDATELAEVIAATLERINITALHATHAERALEVYHAERPDLILLDLGLPDMTGWKIMDMIKEESESTQPVVIVITAHGDPANRLMGKLQGVHSYLIKPFTPNEVERVVYEALAGHGGESTTEDETTDRP